ncbi:DUF1572 family protein [Hymenobacter sp. BT730]|uniref:DUF1572 family protein n=1 Tax=Hymenobacter sp. BT730 TaxID=3063332 RepID=UPI0026E0698A|nr:DUF1572 family protein [Hymenobacter sp. BT730]
MLIETLRQLFNRDLTRLKNEIELYQDEHKLWYVEQGIANSGGNLCLHLIGNLNTYIGCELGGIGYTRNREAEFSQKHLPKANLLRMVEDTKQVVDKSLSALTEANLQKVYPQVVFDAPTSTEYFLVHLTTHLTYHLGQINYHRRLLDT